MPAETFLGNARGAFGELGAIGEDEEDEDSEEEAAAARGDGGARRSGPTRGDESERVVATDVPQ